MIRFVSQLLSALPSAAIPRLAALIGTLLWSVARLRRQVVQENLRLAFPEKSPQEIEELGHKNLQHTAQVALETLRLPRARRHGFSSVTLRGAEHFRAAEAGGRGYLVLSAHLGSWELGAAGGTHHHGLKLSLLVKELGAMQRFMAAERAASGLGTIARQDALRAVLQELKANRGVAIVLDQNATRSIGTFVEFFGRPACTMKLLAVLAARSGAPVLPVFAKREPDGSHIVVVQPPVRWEPKDDLRSTVHHMTARYTQIIEAAVRDNPSQWLWSHKRWRTQATSTQASGAADA